MGLERGPLSLVSTTEDLLEKKMRLPRDNLYPQKLALTSPKNGGLLVGTVRYRTQAKELFMILDKCPEARGKGRKVATRLGNSSRNYC
jgi:hypothetical protein